MCVDLAFSHAINPFLCYPKAIHFCTVSILFALKLPTLGYFTSVLLKKSVTQYPQFPSLSHSLNCFPSRSHLCDRHFLLCLKIYFLFMNIYCIIYCIQPRIFSFYPPPLYGPFTVAYLSSMSPQCNKLSSDPKYRSHFHSQGHFETYLICEQGREERPPQIRHKMSVW